MSYYCTPFDPRPSLKRFFLAGRTPHVPQLLGRVHTPPRSECQSWCLKWLHCLIAPKIGNLRESLVAPQGIDCASWVKGQVTKQFQVPSCRDSLLWCWAAVCPRSQDRCPSKKSDTGQTEQLKTNACESNELSVTMRLDYLWRVLQQNLAKAPGSHPPPSLG